MNSDIKICSRCVLDTTIPSIRFDGAGVCNFCHSHDVMMRYYPRDEKLLKTWRNGLIARIKKSGKNKPYDCIVGVSGGTDSTYTLWMSKELGLRPLAVHLDDGWNSNIAVTNIHNATEKLGVDLETVVLDWEEIRDLHAAFFKASVPDPGVPTDIAIHGALYSVAMKENIKFILGGQSFATEGTQPREWGFIDGTYVQTIHKLYGTVPLRNFPNATIYRIAYYHFIKGIKQIPFLNYFSYSKEDAQKILQEKLNWTYYGGHHYESLYAQFINAYYNINKFGIDRRKVTLSAAVRTGRMSRADALKALIVPPPFDAEMIDYCLKKLGFTSAEFAEIMAQEPKNFLSYHTSYQFLRRCRLLIKMASKMRLITPVLYEKYVG